LIRDVPLGRPNLGPSPSTDCIGRSSRRTQRRPLATTYSPIYCIIAAVRYSSGTYTPYRTVRNARPNGVGVAGRFRTRIRIDTLYPRPTSRPRCLPSTRMSVQYPKTCVTWRRSSGVPRWFEQNGDAPNDSFRSVQDDATSSLDLTPYSVLRTPYPLRSSAG